MKPFDYYSNIGVPYPDHHAYRKQLIDAIDNTPMTAADRTKAMAEVSKQVLAWMNEQSKPYRNAQAALIAEFWDDCRNELGYHNLLNESGVAALESKAYEDGHSSGFGEVYQRLDELVELTKRILVNRR
jgi:hypothetical protein